MNKLKEQLMVALSEEVEYKDFDNAYNVAVDFAVSFNYFLRNNYDTCNKYGDTFVSNNLWRKFNTDEEYTTEELLDKFLEENETLD